MTIKVTETVHRLPWKKFIGQQLTKILFASFALVLFVITVFFSRKVAPDPLDPNPPNIIGLSSPEYLGLIVTSSVLFTLVLVAFGKTILLDHRQAFGISSLKSSRSLWFFILVIMFLSSLYILLDITVPFLLDKRGHTSTDHPTRAG